MQNSRPGESNNRLIPRRPDAFRVGPSTSSRASLTSLSVPASIGTSQRCRFPWAPPLHPFTPDMRSSCRSAAGSRRHSRVIQINPIIQPCYGPFEASLAREAGEPQGVAGLSMVTNFEALVLLRLESEPKRTNSVPHRPIRQNRCAPPRRGRKKNQATTVSACNSAILGFFFRPACASRRVVLVCNRRATQRFCVAPQAPKKPGLVREDLHFAWDSDHLRIPGRSFFVIV